MYNKNQVGRQWSGGALEDYTLDVRHHYYIHCEKNYYLNSVKNNVF